VIVLQSDRYVIGFFIHFWHFLQLTYSYVDVGPTLARWHQLNLYFHSNTFKKHGTSYIYEQLNIEILKLRLTFCLEIIIFSQKLFNIIEFNPIKITILTCSPWLTWRGVGVLKKPRHMSHTIDWLIDCFFVFNATFSNISAISWLPVLVVEEAGIPGENHRPWASNW
jgi:hypothetical protein